MDANSLFLFCTGTLRGRPMPWRSREDAGRGRLSDSLVNGNGAMVWGSCIICILGNLQCLELRLEFPISNFK